MKKLFTFFAAMLVAVAVNADPVVLPATLDVTNVSFRSEGMPDFVLEEGDYAGTYFDMGAHDSSNDTLLYAEWDVTIQPMKYNIAVDVYNTNSWSVRLYLLNQTGDTLKDLYYKGHSGDKGQFAAGSLDLRDLAAGSYKLRARAATAWSALKLKDVIVEADYHGVQVAMPGTLTPAYAELSANASIKEGAIAFKPSTAPDEYANWNVSFAEAGTYNVSIDITASNGHNYGVELIGEDEETSYGAVDEGGQVGDTGEKELGAITVPAAGKYIVHLTNAIQWSEAVLNSITFAAPPAPQTLYLKPGPWYYEGNKEKFAMYAWADGKEAYWSDYMTLAENETDIWTGTIPGGYDKVIFVRFGAASTTPSWEDNMWNQTEDLTIEEGKDLYTITKQDPYDEEHKINPKAEGAWSKYEYVAPAKFYVLGLDNKWTEADAVRSDADSYVAELAAGYYEMKILVDGTWATAKGYDDLTEVAAGLSKNQEYGNICFTLAEAGNVTITYTSTVFKLEGNFYVAPATKFYITGDAALVGEDLAWKPNAIPVNEDSYTFENLPAGSYNLKVTLNGTWEGENNIKGFAQLTEPVTVGLSAGENDNIVFTLKEAGNVVVTYTSEVFKVEGNFVATGIDNTDATVKAVKVMKDGQLYIIKAGKTYNVLGSQMK